tara:strand:- start:1677 stop:2225 length:549 start_codon:yes stop_codon:yes gene_type:complete
MNNYLISEKIFGKKFFSKYYLVVLGIILLTVSSKISLPFFSISMTLQTLIVYFISSFMGMLGFYAILIYLFLGTLGLPIFSDGGGFDYIFSPMYGFLCGMLFASLTINYVIKTGYKNFTKIFLAIFAGFSIMYFIGICYLSYFMGIQKAFTSSFLLLIYSELLKVILATVLIYILMLKFNKN